MACFEMYRLDQIPDKIETLSELDSQREIFGARHHDYQLNPCLSEVEVARLEDRYGIRLLEDYRRFLLEIGNGGAGPYYGVFKLGEHDDGWGHCAWEDGFLLGDPAAPFPYQAPWNLPDTFWSQAPSQEGGMDDDAFDEANEAWNAHLDELYWNPARMNGAIPLCHLGCALRQWLVVTGSERGNIWQDDRVDEGGIYPVSVGERRRVTFSEWYLAWLDGAIRSFGGK